MDLLNNREKALLMWFIIGLIWALAQKNIRQSILEAMKVFFAPQVLVIYTAMAFYILGTVLLLYKANLWSPLLIKDTLIWSLTTACVLLLYINQNAQKEDYFKSLFWDA